MKDLGLFKGRHVLLTGHTGFKGVWLALLLLRAGAEVTGFALDAPTEGGRRSSFTSRRSRLCVRATVSPWRRLRQM